MKIPGFTAEESLYKTSRHYRIWPLVSGTHAGDMQVAGGIYPALPPRDVDTQQCYLDCIDLNSCADKTGTDKSRCMYACKAKCKDPGGGPIVPRKCTWEDYLFKYICYGAQQGCFALAEECGFFYPLCAIPCYQYNCEPNCRP
jgi:hypothetical protein